MAFTGKVEFTNFRDPTPALTDAVALAVQEIFENKIKPDAQELSPVDTGLNQRSITTETVSTGTQVSAQIFTQSGYGGYLELGHQVRGDSGKTVAGRPYIFPAFTLNQPELLEAVKGGVAKLSIGDGK